MVNYRIVHDVKNCIGCTACTLSAPEDWKMGEDGKSHIIGGRKTGEGEEKEIEEKDLEINKLAARVCPVNVIHLIRKDTGEKLI